MSDKQFTNQEIIQLAAAIFAHNPGIYVQPSSDPENAYQHGQMIGKVIAGAVDGFIEAFSEKCKSIKHVDLETEKEDEKKIVHGDCKTCWCHDCGNFEDCFLHFDGLEKKGYMGELCPCDGCDAGMRFMPREKPPACGNHVQRNE